MSDDIPARGHGERIAYVNCSAGVAGDMLLGALVDAGADPDAVATAIAGLGVDGYALTFERVQRGGIAATWANVVTTGSDSSLRPDVASKSSQNNADHHHGHDHGHRSARDVLALVADADLPDAVRARAHRIFATLADAEGAVHGIDPADVEFHEVGSLDAIVDVVGVSAALHSLDIERIVASPIAMGHGSVHAHHGQLPNPPPAVAHMLAHRHVPIVGVDTGMELATPTGVAVLVALADRFGALPAMTVEAVGFGAGTADPQGRPNVVQVLVGTPATESATSGPGRTAVQMAVNVDDVTGEVLAHTIATLVAAGAHDAWATPIVMKKGRPAHTVSALADPADAERLAAIMLSETGSLGIRAATVQRWPQRRDEVVVDVDGHRVRVKLGADRAKAEHDDAVAAARALGQPLREVLRHAESRAARDQAEQ